MARLHDLSIDVYYADETKMILVGKLVEFGKKLGYDNDILFEYTPEFIDRGIELSPFKLPLKPGVQSCDYRPFDGLFGLFNDSLPDGWGKLLLDRQFAKLGLEPTTIRPLEYLSCIGHSGMGALIYAGSFGKNIIRKPHDQFNLDTIYEKVNAFQELDDTSRVDELLALNGSSAGARPKINIKINGESWIIKMKSYMDHKEIGLIEYSYNLMAREAGLNVPDVHLFESEKCPGYFGVKRFDRIKRETAKYDVTGITKPYRNTMNIGEIMTEQRIHMHTISGLLHADHRHPTLDYKQIMAATQILTKDTMECETQFKNAVFNVYSHNRDDHAKNFAFLMDKTGKWRVSPVYDLTFSYGANGEHNTMIAGEGKNPTKDHLLRLAIEFGIEKTRAVKIIDEIRESIVKWRVIAGKIGISKKKIDEIGHKLDAIV